MGRTALCVSKRKQVKKEHKTTTKNFRRAKPAWLKGKRRGRRGASARKRTNVKAAKWRVPVTKPKPPKGLHPDEKIEYDVLKIDDIEVPPKKAGKRKSTPSGKTSMKREVK